LTFVAILATEKVPKPFLQKYMKKLSSHFYNYFFCVSEHFHHKVKKKPHFSRLFSDSQKWTFINVQNQKPIHFCTLKLLTEKYYQYIKDISVTK
jgi:hypothetical protein